LFAFDNAVCRGKWTPEQQAATLKELGYDGISYNYTKPADLAAWLKAFKAQGLKIYGLYVHTFPDKQPSCDPAFKEAIKLLKGSDTVIWMTLRETKDKTRRYDAESIAIVHDLAARDFADETVDRIRSVRTERWRYIRNFLPLRPYLQLNAYKDNKPCVIALRAAEAAGQLNDVQRLLFAKRGRRRDSTISVPIRGKCITSPPIPRDDGATLRGYLRAATDAGADVVLLTSFNEWQETTVVEPSSSWQNPYSYLTLLADWKGLAFTPPPLPKRK
jgi:hypothetical protein